MPMRKTAITVPEELLEAIDRAALDRGESRSRFINRVLSEAVRVRRDAQITQRLNALFANQAFADEQQREAEAFDAQGGAWKDERW